MCSPNVVNMSKRGFDISKCKIIPNQNSALFVVTCSIKEPKCSMNTLRIIGLTLSEQKRFQYLKMLDISLAYFTRHWINTSATRFYSSECISRGVVIITNIIMTILTFCKILNFLPCEHTCRPPNGKCWYADCSGFQMRTCHCPIDPVFEFKTREI